MGTVSVRRPLRGSRGCLWVALTVFLFARQRLASGRRGLVARGARRSRRNSRVILRLRSAVAVRGSHIVVRSADTDPALPLPASRRIYG